MDVLDQEAPESEDMLARDPRHAEPRQPSHIANQPLTSLAQQYDTTIRQAASSDATVRQKWDQWASHISILAGGEVNSLFSAKSRILFQITYLLVQLRDPHHNPQDLWTLPEWVGRYYRRLHIRQHGGYGFDTVLYALPD